MKIKRFFSLIVALILCLLLAVSVSATDTADGDSADATYIFDNAALLNSYAHTRLERDASRLAEQYGIGVYVITVYDYRTYGDDMEDVCHALYEKMKLGVGKERNGVLLFVSMADRDWWLIDVGAHTKEVITDYGYESLKPAFLDPFAVDDWAGGIEGLLSQCEMLFSHAARGEVYDTPMGERLATAYGIAAVIGLIAAIVTCSIFRAQMKTAKRAKEADAYVDMQGVQYRVRRDRFTHISRTRRKIETDSSSSGRSNHSSGGKF